jgi:hypothetical protein
MLFRAARTMGDYRRDGDPLVQWRYVQSIVEAGAARALEGVERFLVLVFLRRYAHGIYAVF